VQVKFVPSSPWISQNPRDSINPREAACARDSDPHDYLAWAQEIFSIGIYSSKYFLGPNQERFLGVRIVRGEAAGPRKVRQEAKTCSHGR
jgi:hypothetical protein